MKKIIITIICAFASIPFNTVQAQCTVNRFCLSFTNPVVNTTAATFEFNIVISGGDTNFGLGSSNIQFNYNNAALANPTIVTNNLGAGYQTPIITTPNIPGVGQVGSLNIELNTTGAGLDIPMTTGVAVARIRFTILNPALSSNLVWFYNGGTTQTIVYDHNETLQLCSFNNACLVPLSTLLPINLTAFNIHKQEKSFDLSWVTEEEVNFNGFSLEKSESNLNSFKEITFIDGKGRNELATYNYEDKDVTSNVIYYYRLKMMDLDGSFTYSSVVSGRLDGEINDYKVYPNPISKSDDLTISTAFSGVTQLTIWDNNSKLLIQKEFNQTTLVDLKNYSTGIYYYKLTSEGTSKYGNFSVIE